MSTNTIASASRPTPIRRVGRGIVLLLVALVLFGAWAWCLGAIYFSNLPGAALRTIATALFGVGWIAAFALLPRRRRTMACFLVAFAIVLTWWWLIPASNDRDWQPEHARMPRAEIDGSRVTVHNIRNCDYRTVTDFDVRYEDRTFDLDELESVDFVCSSWGLEDIVHTMLTFGFRDGRHIVLSVIPRREKDEPEATSLGSLFKQYELLCVLADECDVLRLRTNFRKENVYLFPTTTTPAEARTLFLAVLDRVNALVRQPRYYNLVTHNCTTGLVPIIETVYPTDPRFDWRYLLNANTVRMSYDDGHIATPLSFEETLAVCHVNQYVKDRPECDGYSERIRPDLQAVRPSAH